MGFALGLAEMKNKQIGDLHLPARAVKTTKQGNVEKSGCEGASVDWVIREGSMEAMI